MLLTQIRVSLVNLDRQFAYVQVHEKGRSRYNYFFNWEEMIRLELKGEGTGYFYNLEMYKNELLFNCHKPEHKIYLSSCVNTILSSCLKCQLPWDPIVNSSLELCTGKDKVEEFYNATVSLAESSVMNNEINKICLLVPNCETRFWYLTNGNLIKSAEGGNLNETLIEVYTEAGSKVGIYFSFFK